MESLLLTVALLLASLSSSRDSHDTFKIQLSHDLMYNDADEAKKIIDDVSNAQIILDCNDLHFDGILETDKYLFEMKTFNDLQEYKEEDVIAMDSELPTSYVELLQTGQSKRVQADKNIDPSIDTFVSKCHEELLYARKSNRKRKLYMGEKMKTLYELENGRKRETTTKEKVLSSVNEKSSGDNALINISEMNVCSYELDDMETILLVYTKKKTINDMYFSLRKTYQHMKKEDDGFKSWCKDVKNPDSHTMIKKITMWLIDTKKVLIHGCTPLSARSVEIVC